MQREVYTFLELYDRAKVEVVFVSEKQAIEAFYNDCCQVIVVSRTLSAEEEKKFKASCDEFSVLYVTTKIVVVA